MEVSLCIFPGYFLSKCSLELMIMACFERLYSQTSLYEARKALQSCISNVADICPVTLWKLEFIMDKL